MTKLATFKIDETLWENFKQWAKAKGSNASSELIQYIKSCIDSNIETTSDVDLDDRIDKIIEDRLKSLKDKLEEIEKFIHSGNINVQQKLLPESERGKELSLSDKKGLNCSQVTFKPQSGSDDSDAAQE